MVGERHGRGMLCVNWPLKYHDKVVIVHVIYSSLKIFISLLTKFFIAYISYKTVIIYLHSTNRFSFLRETPCFVSDNVLSYYFEHVNIPPEFFFHVATPSGPWPPQYRGFTIKLRHTTVSRTPLDERSAHRTDLYLTTHNTHNRQMSMPQAWFEPTIPAGELLQNHAWDRVTTHPRYFPHTHKKIASIYWLQIKCHEISCNFRCGIP
jgi:hypothetical protein